MKRQSILISTVTLLVVLFTGGVWAGTYSGGTGEPNDPYQIADVNDLLALAADTNDYGKCFILTADIDMEGQVFTTAIIAADTSSSDGFQGTAFTGTFDGNSYKITNFAIDGGSNGYLGLFGKITGGGTVKNLGLENCAVSGGSDSWYIGGLVGYNYYGSISNCYSTGTVSGGSGSYCVGGLVGDNAYGSISNCYSTGSVNGYSYVGGLVGGNWGSISHCYSTSAVSGTSDVGGLVGFTFGSISVSDCYSTGTVSGWRYVGGLVGENYGSSGSINNCYSTGSVSGSSDSSFVGGLVGYNHFGSINNCYSTGAVSGSSYVGGLVGFNYMSSISNCYSMGSVSGTSYVGGLVGYPSGGSISSSYFLSTSGPYNDLGTPLTDEEMKQQSSFIGWDFTNETANGTNDYWRMCVDGVDYPRLNWESIAGDFMCPDGVNVEDLDYFVQRWLLGGCASSNNCGGADIDGSGVVDFADFAIFAQHWLEGI